MTTTPHECVDALHYATEKLGESPTKAQYEELGLRPASATVMRTMGGWNEAKRKAGLETSSSRGSRIGPMPERLEFTEEEWSAMSVDQRWHYRNVEWNTERTLRRRARLRRWLHEYKVEHDGCTRCAEDDPACLDFHHVRKSDKDMAVNEMVPFGYSREAIRAELDKCVLLCANCHRQEHHAPRDLPDPRRNPSVPPDREPETREEIRRWSYHYRRASSCARCGVTDPRCLEFHHVEPGEKVLGVGRMITDGYDWTTIREEVTRCDVLCANCHRREHHDPPPSLESDRV